MEMKSIPSEISFFLVSLMTFAIIPLGPIAGILSDRFGRKTIVLVSTLTMSVSFVLISNLGLPLLLWPVALLSVAYSFAPPTLFSLQSRALPPEAAGLSFGIYGTFASVASAVGPYVVSLTRDSFSGSAPVFFAMAAFCLMSSVLALFIRPKKNDNE